MPSHSGSPDKVVLIHGWFSHRMLMKPLQWRLQRAGFTTYNWGFPSLRLSIEQHAEQFCKYLQTIDSALDTQRFHIIAHSLGSIVTRCALRRASFKNLERVVMLCPPNRGSHMARRASAFVWRRLKTLDEISDRADSFVNLLPVKTGVQVGIVVASGDRVVGAGATRLDDATDYVTVPGMHNAVLFNRHVAELCNQFLTTGKFISSQHAAPGPATSD